MTVVQYLPFSSHDLIYRLGVVYIAVLTLSTCWILPIPCLLKQGTRVIVTALLQRLPPWHAVVVYFAYIFSLSVLTDQCQIQPQRSIWREERQNRDVTRLAEQRSSFCLSVLFSFALRGNFHVARRLLRGWHFLYPSVCFFLVSFTHPSKFNFFTVLFREGRVFWIFLSDFFYHHLYQLASLLSYQRSESGRGSKERWWLEMRWYYWDPWTPACLDFFLLVMCYMNLIPLLLTVLFIWFTLTIQLIQKCTFFRKHLKPRASIESSLQASWLCGLFPSHSPNICVYRKAW